MMTLAGEDIPPHLVGGSRRVGNVTAATIPGLNKDDYQVGERAINRDATAAPSPIPFLPTSSRYDPAGAAQRRPQTGEVLLSAW
jgi:hypothetical protein